jgi:hypothetical protein
MRLPAAYFRMILVIILDIILGRVIFFLGVKLLPNVTQQFALLRHPAYELEHSHFCCDSCRENFDVKTPLAGAWNLPPGFDVSDAEVSLKGALP